MTDSRSSVGTPGGRGRTRTSGTSGTSAAIAATKWLERWRTLFDDVEPGQVRAVQQGRALMRRGRVDSIEIEPGRLATTVHDGPSAPGSVRVEVDWPVAETDAWDRALRSLARDLRAVAALLEGTVTNEVAARLEEEGVQLTPRQDALVWRCSCGEDEICRHVVALLESTATRFGRQPTAVLTLCGRPADALLRHLAAAPDTAHEIDTSVPFDEPRGPLDAVHVHPAPPRAPTRLLDRLGAPPVASLGALEAIVERAAAMAWRIAAGEGGAAADEEVLLAELRAQRTATASTLARSLGVDDAEVRDRLDELYADGRVLRTGAGEHARYRIAPRAPAG
jgi:uncharacterized Zn finger protein